MDCDDSSDLKQGHDISPAGDTTPIRKDDPAHTHDPEKPPDRDAGLSLLRNKAAALDALFAYSSDIIYIHDLDGRFINASNFAFERLGYTREEIGQMTFQSLLPEEQLPIAYAALEELKNTGRLETPSEFRLRCKDGGHLWIEAQSLLLAREGHSQVIFGVAREITKRKRMEEDLQESASKYQMLFDTANDAIVIFKGDRITDCNQRALELFGYQGYDPALIIGRSIYDFFPEKQPDGTLSREKGLALYETVLQGDSPFLEWEYLRSDGTPLLCEISLNLITIGGEASIQAIIRDITSRRRTEDALRESEDKFRKMADSNAAAIVIHKGTHLIYANAAAEKLSGYRMDELFNMGFWELVHPDFLSIVKDRGIARTKGAHPPDRYEALIRTKSGELRWAEVTAATLELDGETAVIGTAYDITERKQIEESLRRSEEKYRIVIENASEAIVVVQDARMIFANPATIRISGFTAEELTDKPFAEFIHPDDIPQVADAHLRRLQGMEAPRTYQFRFIDKNKHTRWVDMSTTMIQWEGRPAVLTFLSDITEARRSEEERRKLEEVLRHSQKMEAVGTLAGGIAHDFNNLLAAIMGYIEIARMRIENPEARDRLDKAIQASRRAKDLVSRILSFSRQRDQCLQPVRLAPIIHEAATHIQASLPATIAIHLDIEDENAVAAADPTQIHQVLMNLCANAVHAMREGGGELHIRLRHQYLDASGAAMHPDLHAGDYLRITVEDTGHGIPPEILERIFEPYFTTKEEREGTGLGLAVIHGIVRGHGGAITVESALEKGSAFHVFIPTAASLEVPSDAKGMAPLPRGHERILFVDDQNDLVEIGKEMLKTLGYAVITRTSSMEALELFRSQPEAFDLVITDLTMPNLTGDVLAKKILHIRPDMPIILCTGYDKEISRERALALGLREYLLKPVDLPTLARAIRAAVDNPPVP